MSWLVDPDGIASEGRDRGHNPVRWLFRILGVLGVVALLAGLVMIGVRRLRQYPNTLLRQAIQAEEEGEMVRAQALMKRYLALRPHDGRALARHALVLAGRATTPQSRVEAYLLLQKALIIQADQPDVSRAAVTLAIELGRYADARHDVEILLRSRPEDGELEQLLGYCYEAENQPEKAAEHDARAVELAPQRIEAYTQYARLLRSRLNESSKADALIDSLVATNPRSARAYLERYRYRKDYRLQPDAQDIVNARRLAPDDPDVLLEAARQPTRDEAALDALSKDLERAIERDPSDSRLYLARAAVAERKGQTDTVLATLRRGIEQVPDHADLSWRLANALIDANRIPDVAAVVEELKKLEIQPMWLDHIAARLLVVNERWAEAARSFEQIRLALKPDPSLREYAGAVELLIAYCYGRLGEDDQRLAACRRAKDIDPASTAARRGYADALRAMGKIGEAIEQYRELMPTDPRLRLTVAQLLLAEALRRPVDERRWEDVEGALDEASLALPESPDVSLTRAEVYAARGDIESARFLLERSRDRWPDRVDFWIALAYLTGREDGAQATLPVLDAAKAKLGDRVELRLARLNYWVDLGGPGARKALAQLEEGLDRFARDEQKRLLSGLASAYDRLGIRDEAKRLWSRMAERDSNDLPVRIALLRSALRGEDEAGAKRALDEIRRIDGATGPRTALGEIHLLLWRARKGDKSGLHHARQLAEKLASERPISAGVAVCRAECEDLSGNLNKAIECYQQAIELGERAPAILRRTVALLNANRQYSKADELIGKLREQGPLTGESRRLAERVALQVHGPDAALESARGAVADGSGDYRDHLWLAQLLPAAGFGSEVEPVLRRAVTLSGGAPEAWIALVEHLARSGRTKEAELAVREAEGPLSKANPPLALARCYELIGSQDRARAIYQTALRERPKDPAALREAARFEMRCHRTRDAEALMRSLIALDEAAPSEAAWARWNLALLLSEGGDYRRSQEALALLDRTKNARIDPSSDDVDDERVRATILTRQIGRPRRKEAIRLLEHVIARTRVRAEDRSMLATLYEEDGDWPKAREQLSKLKESQDRNPAFLAQFARSLLRHGERDAAADILESLVLFDSHGPASVEIEARILHAEGKGEQAADLVVESVKDKDDRSILGAATLLEELGQTSAAEAMFRLLASRSKRPESALALAEFLARHGHAQEALDICERAWKERDPEVVAAACATIAATTPLTEEQRRRVVQWLEAAMQKDPRSPSLPFRLAIIREILGDYPAAEDLYRQAIARGLRKTTPLANLAKLLALREGRGAEALELINRAIALGGPLPGLLDTRAVVYLTMGQDRLAIKDLEQANTIAPGAIAYFHLSRAHLAAQDAQEASVALRKAEDAGLTLDRVHPLERAAYQKLTVELGPRLPPAPE